MTGQPLTQAAMGSGCAQSDSATVADRPFAPWEWVLMAGLVVAVFLVYQPAWRGGVLWDDDGHITRPDLRSWDGLCRIWVEPAATQQYYPVLHSAFWIEHRLWGDDTLGYHLVNILLHAMAAVMVALILRRLTVPGAYLAAAIFALHPVHVESVAWITELKNTLSGVFYLSAMLVYLRFDQTRKRPLYFWACGLFALGLLSKTVTATLPAALLVIFWWQRNKLSWKRDVLPLIPMFAMGALAGLYTAFLERTEIGAEGAEFNFSIIERCLIAGRAIWFYLGKLVWPTDLIFIYPRWNISGTDWRLYLYLAAALVLLAAAWMVRRRWRAPLAGLLFFIGTLFPVLGFCNVYPFIFSFVADHFQYLASLGVIALVAAGIALLLKRLGIWGRPAGNLLCLGLLATLGVLTWRQSHIYVNAEVLYRTVIAGNPECWMAHNNLGKVLQEKGQTEEAIAEFRRTLELNPTTHNCEKAYNSLGLALQSQGKFDEALAWYRRAIDLNPGYATPYNSLGLALAQMGRVEDGIVEFQKAIEIKPAYPEPHFNMGLALRQLGRNEAAIAEFEQAVHFRPEYVKARLQLGLALADGGRLDEAIVQFQILQQISPNAAEVQQILRSILTAYDNVRKGIAQKCKLVRSRPDDVVLLNETAWLLATNPNKSLRNGAEAVRMAERSSKLSGGNEPAVLDTLAAAYAEAGRFNDAVETAQKALKLATQQGKHTLSESLKARIRLYKSGVPFHETPSPPRS